MIRPAATPQTDANAAMSISNEGRRQMQSASREGLVRGYYNDGGDTRGNCTYGVGIKVHNGPCTTEELGRPLSAAQIAASFDNAIRVAEGGVRRNVRTQALSQEQFDALVSFVYNVGVTRALSVLQHIDQGQTDHAVSAMTSMTSARQNGRLVHMPGLVNRRREETAPFRPNP
jgi:lysozyme